MKEANTFDCYRTYYDKQDDSRKVFNAQLRRQPFETFTEASRNPCQVVATLTPSLADCQILYERDRQHWHSRAVG